MPLPVTKDCFPSPSKCHNCERKSTEAIKTNTDPKGEYKRCVNCHLVTYCDKDCQKEHWIKVHKKHCKFLSGKILVENSEHNAAACAECIAQNQATPTQLRSENSPKTICIIAEVDIVMKKALGDYFSFHEHGKKCDCSHNYGLELPFPLGEVSGQFLDIAGTMLDAMLAHVPKILTAMTVKAKKQEHKNALAQLWKDIIGVRSQLWYDILVHGMAFARPINHLSEQVGSLKTIYGASNPWLKTLVFSIDFVVSTNRNLYSNSQDSHSLEDSRFQNLKLVHDYRHSQLQKQAIACEKETWPNFLLWPELVNGSLAVLLPPSTRCQSCFAQLGGEVAVTAQEFNYKNLPGLLSEVSDNGALMACCSVIKNRNCVENCMSKNVEARLQADEEQLKAFSKESKILGIESRECDFCLKLSLSSHRCSACLTVQYCSIVCQKKDSNFHMTVCSSWAKDESRKIFNKRIQKNYRKSLLEKQ